MHHQQQQLNDGISTHAPLAGRDAVGVGAFVPVLISTHAPLAGRDDFEPLRVVLRVEDFNPRAPCGARRTC